MIDLHCHILPGIDDGSQSWEESIAMAKIAAGDGVTTIVATPHIREYIPPVDLLLESIAKLNAKLESLGVPVEILFGGDVFALLPPEEVKKYTIGKSKYVLIEFQYTHIPINAPEILFKLALIGLKPIITHPERIPTVIRNPELVSQLLPNNVLIQITADSLAGRFGRAVQDCAKYLLKKNYVHIIASDAHSATSRLPNLSHGLQVAEKILGQKDAYRLVYDNPAAVLGDIPIQSNR